MAGMEMEEMEQMEQRGGGAPVTDPRGVLRQGRAFLDFFWDIAKPEQEVRLAATESLLRHLREGKKDDELKYTLKRLVEGLGATREAARPGFSLALAQVLQAFEEIPLCSILEQIKEKHNLEKVKKKLVRNAAFGNFFGVMALFQSGRLVKDRKALLESIQLLQQLTNHQTHLRDLPRKTLIDITSEVPETVFEEVLFDILQGDLSSAFTSPENLHLLLVGMQKFPGVLKPKKLKKLFGSPTVVNEENISRLVELLKSAAKSEKEDKKLPSVVFDLLQVALKEGAFELFWNEVVENGLLKEKSGPVSYMCYRLLGSALPLLSMEQLQVVLKGKVMLHYGEHVVATQFPQGFKFAAEMEGYIDAFLSGCDDPERQLAVMKGFSTLTNQGKPVLLSASRVVRHLQAVALQKYICWLKDMFLRPDLDCCLEFSSNRQKQNRENADIAQQKTARLRKWIIHRLVNITESATRKEESLVMDIARFCFFHAFFVAKKKKNSQIAEASVLPSEPLNERDHTEIENYFFGLLQTLNTLPVLGDTAEAAALREKHVHGVTVDGKLWVFLLAEYANKLLSSEHVKAVKPFTEEQRDIWERTLQSVKNLQKKENKSDSAKVGAFQQLLLSIAIHLFKNESETVDILSDLLNCTEKAFSKEAKKKKKTDNSEPGWVEVMVEILLSLLAQPSLLLRRISKSVFVWICPNLTKRGLQLILDVFDPNQEQNEESAVVVMEESNKKTKSAQDTDEEGSEDSSDEDNTDSGDEENEEVDENFRSQLMKVLQAGNTLEEDKSDEELDDEAMMALDKSISALFAEQQKRIQAKKDEKDRMRKEKILRRDFKAKVLDLIDVFLVKQAENPLVFDIIEPLLHLIEQSMSSDSDKQELDFLQKTANIFKNSLCRNKQYCKRVASLQEDLHALVQRLVEKACKHTDSAVALYYFSASLYLLKVLKGNTSPTLPPPEPKKQSDSRAQQESQLLNPGCLKVKKVAVVYQQALTQFLSKRNSPLTCSMFHDLFKRFPIMCKPLVDTLVKFITAAARQHQQAMACMLLHKVLLLHELKLFVTEKEWEELITRSISQVTECLKTLGKPIMKAEKEKVVKSLELLNFLLKTVTGQKLNVKLTEVEKVLLPLKQLEDIGNSPRLDSLYWNVMRWLNYTKPKKEKTASKPTQGAELLKRKKKGFLPETKKRKNRKKGTQENGLAPGGDGEAAAPEEQPLGAETPKHKKGLVPGGSKKHPKRAGRENGAAKEGGGELPTANGGDAVADKKKKKRKNRKRKGAAGSEAEQVPAAKKAKGSVVQETQQKQDKAKKKRKEKQAPVLQE
ncbi:myb-binding protein 1A [Hirundo rustica]|uniref:myb-binding protein 1A n=1 Tax=Hirundo rustica TaxID=43150 RepID=UPI001A9526B7|nr:myb-binding protein 1A [Hirundo rustica]XP_058279023.1 myb-binding protein 1A [Hirundo rustica]